MVPANTEANSHVSFSKVACLQELLQQQAIEAERVPHHGTTKTTQALWPFTCPKGDRAHRVLLRWHNPARRRPLSAALATLRPQRRLELMELLHKDSYLLHPLTKGPNQTHSHDLSLVLSYPLLFLPIGFGLDSSSSMNNTPRIPSLDFC
jgi:hypothetical protein